MARKKLEILSEQMYYVLLSLHSGPMHGYRIMQYVTALTQGRVVMAPGHSTPCWGVLRRRATSACAAQRKAENPTS